MLTPHCSAASGMVAPPSIVPTTRLRRSAEYGFAIPAGLLPAGSLNHIRAAMGIPDSAFSGNALALSLRPRQVHFSFSSKNIAVEVGDPLGTAGGHIEIADRKLDLRSDVSPIKLREFINDIGGRRVAQLPV